MQNSRNFTYMKINLPQFWRSQVNCITRGLMGYQAEAHLFLVLKVNSDHKGILALSILFLCVFPSPLCWFHVLVSAAGLCAPWWSQWTGNGLHIHIVRYEDGLNSSLLTKRQQMFRSFLLIFLSVTSTQLKTFSFLGKKRAFWNLD